MPTRWGVDANLPSLGVGADGYPIRPLAADVWTAQANPAANVKATVTRPAAGPRTRNVLTSLTAMVVAGATAPTATTVTVAVIDGGAGGTTYLWGPHTLGVPAVAGATNGLCHPPLWIPGSPNTPMTMEFSAAAGINTLESVSMVGETVQG